MSVLALFSHYSSLTWTTSLQSFDHDTATEFSEGQVGGILEAIEDGQFTLIL